MQCLTCLGGLKIDSWTGKISGFDCCVPKTRFLIMNFLFCCQFLHIQYSFPMETFKSSSQLELRYRFLTECYYHAHNMQPTKHACNMTFSIYSIVPESYADVIDTLQLRGYKSTRNRSVNFHTCIELEIPSRSLRISWRFFVPRILRRVVWANSRVDWCALATFAIETIALLTR